MGGYVADGSMKRKNQKTRKVLGAVHPCDMCRYCSATHVISVSLSHTYNHTHTHARARQIPLTLPLSGQLPFSWVEWSKGTKLLILLFPCTPLLDAWST